MKPFTVGSLFAGIGGFDLAAERAGMVVKWQCEIDDFCNKVLAKHWPNVARYKDVKEVGKHNLEPVDLICGGFPCQPHSVAGKRRGKEDNRDLWPEYLRIIKEVRPRWVVAENVPGIITTILDQVLSDLEGADYTAETLIIPAVSFDAPHRRDRVWIVAHTEKQRTRNECENIREAGREVNPPNNAGCTSGRIDKPGNREVVANPSRSRLAQWNGSEDKRRTQTAVDGCNWWSTEPNVGRVAHGVPQRVDKLRSLGNAIVPQVAEFIFRNILEVERVTNAPQ